MAETVHAAWDRPDFDLVWHVVVPWLTDHGAPRSIRSALGQIARDRGRTAILAAFDAVLQARPRPADPWTYFLKIANGGNHARPLSPAEQALAAAKQRIAGRTA